MHNTEIKYSRLSLIRFSRGKIIYLNEREIGIIESRSNSNYWLKLPKNRITEREIGKVKK